MSVTADRILRVLRRHPVLMIEIREALSVEPTPTPVELEADPEGVWLIERVQLQEALSAACRALEASVEIMDGALVATNEDEAREAAYEALSEYEKRGGPRPREDLEIEP
jgi:2-polyprenyl-6-methoxyphenol hydroxylase-like FAD-dependent oxidoreductase